MAASLVTEADNREERVCWICLESGITERRNELWCHPCRCRNTLKWVHHHCLQRWIDEQHGTQGTSTPISCRVCGTQYEITYPKASLFYLLLEAFDERSRILSYYVAGGLVLGSFYWAAVTYGAVTIMQVFGHRHGLRTMKQADPLLLLFGLPTIPVCLILSKLIPWERGLQIFWRRHVSRWRIVRWLSGSPNWPMREAVEPRDEGYELPRAVCSALALPTVATITGRMLFRGACSDLNRTLLGGIAYLGVKGVLSVTYQEMRYIRICSRKVKDCEEQ